MTKRILIVRLSSLGDVVLTIPLLFALRERMPDAYIGWVVGEPAVPLIEDLTLLDQVHIWPRKPHPIFGLRSLVKEISDQSYNVSIDPQGLTKSSMLPFLSGIKYRIGFERPSIDSRELAPFLNNQRTKPPNGIKHVISRNLFLATKMDLQMPEFTPVQLSHNHSAHERMLSWFDSLHIQPPTMIFGIGAGFLTKIWPVEEIAVLVAEARKQGFSCLVLWGPQEKEKVDGWKQVFGDLVIWTPPTDLREMIALLRLCDRYVGPDSLALHLAATLGLPTFSWFGPTDPSRCAPQGPTHSFVARGSHHFQRTRHDGLRSLKGSEVLQTFQKWLLK